MPKQLASTLHLLLCKRSHVEDCKWYMEDQQVESWQMPEHVKWTSRAEGLILLSKQSETELVTLLQQLVGIISKLSFLKNKFPELAEVIDTILTEASNK